MRRHPAKHELFAHAEALEDGNRPISARIGKHVAGCRRCGAEVRALRTSLSAVSTAPVLEPSAASTVRLLHAARQERQAAQQESRPVRALCGLAKGLAAAAALIVVGAVSFRTVLDTPPSAANAPARASAVSVSFERPSEEAIRRAKEEAESLYAISDAVRARNVQPRSPQEHQYLRAIRAVEADIQEALLTLEQDPTNVRAWHVLNSKGEYREEMVKTYYFDFEHSL